MKHTFIPQIKGGSLKSNYTDVEAKINCGVDQCSCDQYVQLELSHENHLHAKNFAILTILMS